MCAEGEGDWVEGLRCFVDVLFCCSGQEQTDVHGTHGFVPTLPRMGVWRCCSRQIIWRFCSG